VTGGYPIIAGVIRADWPRLAQLRPGDEVRFMTVELEAARALAETEWEIREQA
jgi:allophanate hydrolase subunit 2